LEAQVIGPEELRLIGLSHGQPLPADGLVVHGVLKSGTGSSKTWTDQFETEFGQRWGIRLQEGSLNIQLPAPIGWNEPLTIRISGQTWEFVPVVLNEIAIGVAFRGNQLRPDLLEIASPVKLRDRLGTRDDGIRISVRLLSGLLLGSAV
jgi:CTP-dependent riboflavin kinase